MHYNIRDYLFMIKLLNDGFVLIPEQSNHYGNHNIVIPHLYVSYIKCDDKPDTLSVTARSDAMLIGSVFVTLCALMTILAGEYVSGIMIFIIANAILQIAFWLPCQKALREIQKIIDE